MLLLQRMLFLRVVAFHNGKTAAHWSCGPERSGPLRQTGWSVAILNLLNIFILFTMSSVTHSIHTHTNTHSLPPPSFLLSPCTWFQDFTASVWSFCAALIILGSTTSMKQKSKPVEGLKRAVQLLVWNTQHVRRIIPRDTTGAAVWTIGMRQLCLTEKVVQTLTIRIFFPSEKKRGCIKLCLNCVWEELFHRTYGFACESLVTFSHNPFIVRCGRHALTASILPQLISHLLCVAANLYSDIGLSISEGEPALR